MHVVMLTNDLLYTEQETCWIGGSNKDCSMHHGITGAESCLLSAQR